MDLVRPHRRDRVVEVLVLGALHHDGVRLRATSEQGGNDGDQGKASQHGPTNTHSSCRAAYSRKYKHLTDTQVPMWTPHWETLNTLSGRRLTCDTTPPCASGYL